MHLWDVTEAGAEVVEAVATRTEPRRKLLSPEQAGGLLQEHTIAVNEGGLCFVRDARCLGHDASWAIVAARGGASDHGRRAALGAARDPGRGARLPA